MKRHLSLALTLMSVAPAHAAADTPHQTETHAAAKLPPDTRVLVKFPDDAQYFLQTMRKNLSDINEIHRAVADANFEHAAHIAEFNLGLGGIKTHNALAVAMPDGMQNMGMAFHQASSQLAQSLKEQSTAKIFNDLANVTQTCVMCHDLYRVR